MAHLRVFIYVTMLWLILRKIKFKCVVLDTRQQYWDANEIKLSRPKKQKETEPIKSKTTTAHIKFRKLLTKRNKTRCSSSFESFRRTVASSLTHNMLIGVMNFFSLLPLRIGSKLWICGDENWLPSLASLDRRRRRRRKNERCKRIYLVPMGTYHWLTLIP